MADNIKEKIEQHLKDIGNEFSEDELSAIFGFDFKERKLDGSFANTFDILFEDEGKIYLTGVLEDNKDIIGNKRERGYSLSSRDFIYKELDKQLLKELNQRMEVAKRELSVLEKALSHEKYRIKSMLG